MAAIVTAMNDHMEFAAVQQWGARAILTVTFGSDEPSLNRKREAASAGAVQAIARAMEAHPDQPGVQLWGCRALLTIAVGPLPIVTDVGAAGPSCASAPRAVGRKVEQAGRKVEQMLVL